MRSFAKFCKYGLALAPMGGIAYISHAPHAHSQQAHTIQAQESQLTGYFKDYVEQNNLISSALYKKYQQKYKFNHFFEKGILQQLEGLDDYNLFLDKNLHDVLHENSNLSTEEKQKILENSKIHCTFNPKSKLQSHVNKVHSGFTSTIFDNVAGCLAFMACDLSPAVTAYLNVSHERNMTLDTEYVAVVEVDKIEGRKVFLKGRIMDKDNNVYANMESLFVKPKKDAFYLRQLYKYLLLDPKEKNIEQKTQDGTSAIGSLWRQATSFNWTTVSQ